MQPNFNDRWANSLADFDTFVSPWLYGFAGLQIVGSTERNPSQISTLLDASGSVDYLLKDEAGTLYTIASRMRRTPVAYNDFLIRHLGKQRQPLEYTKIKRAIERGGIYPRYYVQAYINPLGDRLMSVAMAKTVDIIDYIAQGNAVHKDPGDGRETFYIVPWKIFRPAGLDIWAYQANPEYSTKP